MYTTVLHELFPRVEVETFKPLTNTCQRITWGEQAAEELTVHPDDLMDYVLQQRHSFAFPKADGIRAIRVWDREGSFIDAYDAFLSMVGVVIESDPESRPSAGSTSNPYLSTLRISKASITSSWTKLSLLKMWMNLRTVSIGAGANKEMVEVSVYGRLQPEFDIELEKLIDATSKDITKAAKYLGRLLRPFRYFSKGPMTCKQINWEVDAFIDGWTASVDLNYCKEILELPDVSVGDRLEITGLDTRGLLKGHGTVGDHPESNVILYGDQYKQILKGTTLNWFAVERLHGSDEAYLDIQTLVNLGERVFPEHVMQGWITETISSAVEKTKYAKLPAAVTSLDSILREPSRMYNDRWSLRRMALHDLPSLLPVMLRKSYAFHRSSIRKLNNLRVRIPGAIRRYISPDLSGEVEAGKIRIQGDSFFIAKADADWIMTLHGGADNDDSFVLIPITENRVLLYRNPNQIGEWSVMQIQESDIQFSVINYVELPTFQRNNYQRDDLTVDKIMETVSSFWEHLVSRQLEVDSALVPRIPERYREHIPVKEGWITRLFKLAEHHLSLADEAIQLYSEAMDIPEQLITSPRSSYYEFAKDLRQAYGHGIRVARERNRKLAESTPASEEELELDLKRRIEKVHGQVRGALSRIDPGEQKLVILDLMRICYMELPGTTVGKDEYILTQANDGILGIPSSSNGRSRGTFDILIDVLNDAGFGRKPSLDEGQVLFKTTNPALNYSTDSVAVRIIGGWQSIASQLEGKSLTEDHLVSLAYRTVKETEYLQIRSKRVIIDGQEFGRIVNRSHVPDGKYQVMHPGSPGKSQILQVCECLPNK